MAIYGTDLKYRDYLSNVKNRLSPNGIALSPIGISKRYPSRFEGTTIISDPKSSAHTDAYKVLQNYQAKISVGNCGLASTPVSSFHMTLLGITHAQLQANSVESGNMPKIIDRVNLLLGSINPSITPHFMIGGFTLLTDAVVAPLYPLNEESYESMINIREHLLGDPTLKAYGITSGPVTFHITTHYFVGDTINRQRLNASLNKANTDMLSIDPVIYPIDYLMFTAYSNLDSFQRIAGSSILRFPLNRK
jgi:hypothetical protein